MKYFNIKTLLFAVLALTVMSCEEELPELGEPSSKVLGIQDNWVLTSVTQMDLLTPFSENELDVSDIFIGDTPATMTFDGSNYTINYGTTVEGLLGTGGGYAFDDNDFPSLITLNSNGTDYVVNLNRTVREIDPTLEFELRKSCGGVEAIAYKYVFARQ